MIELCGSKIWSIAAIIIPNIIIQNKLFYMFNFSG